MTDRIARLREPPDPALVDRLEMLIRDVARALDEGEDCRERVDQINALAGQQYEPQFFFELDGWTSEREAAELAAKGTPPVLDDLTREELLEIVEIIKEPDEPNSSFFLELLDLTFPGSAPSDVIHYPHRDLSPEEEVDEILLRHELYRAGGMGAVRAREAALAEEVMAYPNAPPWSRTWAQGILKRGGSAEE